MPYTSIIALLPRAGKASRGARARGRAGARGATAATAAAAAPPSPAEAALPLLLRAAALCDQAPLLAGKVNARAAALLGAAGQPHAALRALHASLGCSVRQQYRGVLQGKLLAAARRRPAVEGPSAAEERLSSVLAALSPASGGSVKDHQVKLTFKGVYCNGLCATSGFMLF